MTKLCLSVFGAFAVFGAVVGAALPAGAWTVRQNGSYCMTDPGAAVSHNGAGVANNSTTAIGRLTCPVIDTSATPKTGILAFNAHVNDQSATAGVTAQACVNFVTVAGGNCGASVSSPAAGTGVFQLSPPRTFWGAANASDSPYVLIVLPARTTATPSWLMGYSFSG